MKIRFCAALLIAALSLTLFTGCAAVSAVPAPSRAVIDEPALPLSPEPVLAPPAPTVSAPASSDTKLITKEEATAIALADAGFTADQVTRLRVEFDYDDGRPEYEVDFHQGGFEYDYEIHAETGAILSKDKDRED